MRLDVTRRCGDPRGRQRDGVARSPSGRRKAEMKTPTSAVAVLPGHVTATNTQRVVWYDSQGPQRSVIGRTLR